MDQILGIDFQCLIHLKRLEKNENFRREMETTKKGPNENSRNKPQPSKLRTQLVDTTTEDQEQLKRELVIENRSKENIQNEAWREKRMQATEERIR